MTVERARAVLIVEDERVVAMDLQETLTELGYDAFAIASTAEEAIARASERCPDLVLIDIRIKGQRDGIETAEILKRRFGAPVVFLTAHADERTIERAKEAEPYAYLLKPVKTAELRSAIEVSIYRHAMEKRLRERERWFSTTLRSIADAVVSVDLAGKVVFMNPAAEALTGIKGGDAMGKHAQDILRLMDAEGAKTEDPPLARALRQTDPVELREASLQNAATGACHLISDSAAAVMDEGVPLGAVMVFHDVTEQKNLQKQLELASRLASLGTMASGVAHEINNPLAVVVGNSAFVADELRRCRVELADSLPAAALESCGIERRLDEVAQALSDLESAARRIGHIVSDLRTFARPVEETTGTVDVVRCIDWAVRTTSHEFYPRARLVTRLSAVPLVSGDEVRLGQVFINLLVNAAHSITPGNADRNQVTVTLWTDEKGWIVVEVADTGSGIPKELLGRIFDPFFTTKAVGNGTGLGLSICHGIVASLGGELGVQSEIGKGTRFLVRLPPAVQAKDRGEAATPKPSSTLRGRVLVLDDERAVLRSIERVLRGHDVVCVDSTREALSMIERSEPFDVIFCDLMMPARTGMDFYETLLARAPDLARRVVFITGGIITARIDDFLRSVPNRRIEKPFEGASLREIVQQDLMTIHNI